MPEVIPVPEISEFLLQDFMQPLNLSVKDVADGAGVAVDSLQAILNGESEITPVISSKLGKFFNVSAMLFYDIQTDINGRNKALELQYA